MDIKEIKLEKIRVMCASMISEDALMDTKIETFLDHELHCMQMRLKAYVWATPEKEYFTHTQPATVWQHIKMNYAPKWFIKFFPIKLLKHTHYIREVFPEYKVLNQKSAMHVRIAKDFILMP